MLTELCAELKNYFLKNREGDIHSGTFTIAEGSIESLPFLQNGQYFRIVGSVFNDGVYQYPTDSLTDEIFDGAIWAMAVPPALIALSEEIENWLVDNAAAINSPYQSESFGGYSYSLASGGSNGTGTGASWQGHFAARLNKWRRLSVL